MTTITAVLAPPRRIIGSLSRHLDLLVNSATMMAATVVTSGLGFVYWWLAARAVPEEAVGSASAAVSAMSLIGTIGMFGMGTLLLSELPRTARRRGNLISTCVMVAGLAAALGALGYLLLARFALPGLRAALPSPVGRVVLVVGIASAAMMAVLDEGLVGLLAGRLQLRRNAFFAVAKLVLLGALLVAPVVVTSGELLATWVGGSALSVVGLAATLRRRRGSAAGPTFRAADLRPDPRLLRGRWGQAIDHNLLNLALFVPRTALPLVVAAVLSTRATAAFYSAWMVMTFVAMIPSNIATTLLAVAGDTAASVRAKVRAGMGVALGLGLPLSLGTAVFAHPIMGLFGAEYAAQASGTLRILALGFVPMAIRQFYVAVSRVVGRTRRASLLAVVAGGLEVGAACYGAARGGLTGLALGLLGTLLLEAVVMAPTVVRALRHGATRRGASPAA